MYESMFYLLNLTALTYSQARAKKNYEEILSMVRPNGNCDVNDRRVTEAVIYAYKTLGVTEKRLYYMWNGKPSENEDYDEDEASIDVAYYTLYPHRRSIKSIPQSSIVCVLKYTITVIC